MMMMLMMMVVVVVTTFVTGMAVPLQKTFSGNWMHCSPSFVIFIGLMLSSGNIWNNVSN
jgi:hypothetical protein